MTDSHAGEKSYVITGATRGLGLAAARALAAAPGRRIVLAVRDLDAGNDVARALARRGADVRAMPLDLGSLADVRRFAAGWTGPIAGLACNAGSQTSGGEVRRTADGWEETIAVNHLAHVALVDALWPWLAGGRVVFVGSGTHDPRDGGARRFGFTGGHWSSAAALARGLPPVEATPAQAARDRYATSKLANLATMLALSRRFGAGDVQLFALDPGLMPGTGLARHAPALARLGWNALLPALVPFIRGASTPRRSGATLAWLLTDPSLAGRTGVYVDYRRRPAAASAAALDEALATRILDESLAFVGGARLWAPGDQPTQSS